MDRCDLCELCGAMFGLSRAAEGAFSCNDVHSRGRSSQENGSETVENFLTHGVLCDAIPALFLAGGAELVLRFPGACNRRTRPRASRRAPCVEIAPPRASGYPGVRQGGGLRPVPGMAPATNTPGGDARSSCRRLSRRADLRPRSQRPPAAQGTPPREAAQTLGRGVSALSPLGLGMLEKGLGGGHPPAEASPLSTAAGRRGATVQRSDPGS